MTIPKDFRRRLLRATILTCLIVLSAVCGCGESEPPKFDISGTVSFTGKPIANGTVTFEDSATGVAETFSIQKDGTYVATVPEGNYGVSVQPPLVTIADTATTQGGDEIKKVDYIPNRYWSSFESGLSVSVSADSTFDIHMVKAKK